MFLYGIKREPYNRVYNFNFAQIQQKSTLIGQSRKAPLYNVIQSRLRGRKKISNRNFDFILIHHVISRPASTLTTDTVVQLTFLRDHKTYS